MVRQMRVLALVNEMSRGEMSVVAAADLARTGDPDTDGRAFPGAWSLVNRMSMPIEMSFSQDWLSGTVIWSSGQLADELGEGWISLLRRRSSSQPHVFWACE